MQLCGFKNEATTLPTRIFKKKINRCVLCASFVLSYVVSFF